MDVAIVGAGLAGASLALHLAEAGVAVALLEARQPGWGASGRNAGHVLPFLPDPAALKRLPDEGRQFLDLFREHHTIPFDLSRRWGIDCDAVQSGYIHGMKTHRAFAAFKRKFAYLEAFGIERLVPVAADEMLRLTGSTAYPYGVILKNGGRVNPYLFTNGMVEAAAGLGAKVFGDSPALKVEGDAPRVCVHTPRGRARADRVVFCTNAYPSDVEPAFQGAFYPLTAYGLTTRPLPPEVRDVVLPGGGTFAQAPLDLNPMVRDRHERLILSSIPKVGGAADAGWHFRSQLRWLHRTWPALRDVRIELEDYWTGRVAMRDVQLPAVFAVRPGVLGLMYFNAWGNVMAPLAGRMLAGALVGDRLGDLPLPVEVPAAVGSPRKLERVIRHVLLPMGRTAQRLRIL